MKKFETLVNVALKTTEDDIFAILNCEEYVKDAIGKTISKSQMFDVLALAEFKKALDSKNIACVHDVNFSACKASNLNDALSRLSVISKDNDNKRALHIYSHARYSKSMNTFSYYLDIVVTCEISKRESGIFEQNDYTVVYNADKTHAKRTEKKRVSFDAAVNEMKKALAMLDYKR